MTDAGIGGLLESLLGERAVSTEEYAKRLADFDVGALLDAALDHATPAELTTTCEESYTHANGFEKVSFPPVPGRAERLRLHLWRRAPLQADPHNHRWALTSRVLAGALRSTTFEAGATGTVHRHYRHRPHTPPPGCTFDELGSATLQLASVIDHLAGQTYALPPETVHVAGPAPGRIDPTVTLALELAPVTQDTDVYTPAGAAKPVGTRVMPPCYTPDEVRARLGEVRQLVAVSAFREVMRRAYTAPTFRHHRWYVPYHLELVERLAAELLDHYPGADRAKVSALVWLHDYGKALHNSPSHQVTLSEGALRLREAGLDEPFVADVVAYARMLDRAPELDLSRAPVEVRIASSADGCAHLVGPFFHLYWWENPDRPHDQLMAENLRKLDKDWHRKIVLPEARAAFEGRHRMLREQAGELPERFLT
ncbi:hypothetical protein [Streptomyces sp. NBC_01304]|uniref:hypothetical protein n=1 Tax=Streptomyces sp. NBC_01304 TaxID=2903818 RepID=UPI002E144AFF|nr:hypothetical protein OG430_16785 [Streptomyces sp. NBC_01304]